MEPLLTRDKFREAVFQRDNHKCVVCGNPADDAHHIMERRLWPDGGYYLSNGASVCGDCHKLCEYTVISPEAVRQSAGITTVVLPPHLYDDLQYDKWGNVVLPNGTRLKGELFQDDSVQKALRAGQVLGQFTDRVKYPRTYHLPWSKGISDDDRVMPSLDAFYGQRVIVTEKMDGENTTVYRDGLHARSVDGESRPYQSWVRNFWAQRSHELPHGWRICGENLWAQHSIAYSTLQSYFMGFSIWNAHNVCLSWDETVLWFDLLGISTVPVLYDGSWEEMPNIRVDTKHSEGYVVRVAREFSYGEFRNVVGKFVRKGHVQTTKHWFHGQAIVPNQLGDSHV